MESNSIQYIIPVKRKYTKKNRPIKSSIQDFSPKLKKKNTKKINSPL